jgi:hypothetical protein
MFLLRFKTWLRSPRGAHGKRHARTAAVTAAAMAAAAMAAFSTP